MLNWNLDSCCGMVEMTGPYRCIHIEKSCQGNANIYKIHDKNMTQRTEAAEGNKLTLYWVDRL
jgi:hypothetical protein